jgi:soluble lytic murein transglycosylase-like protein
MAAALSTIQQQIVAAASSAGVDPAIALAVAQRESGFNQNAIGSSGEVGIFQLMPATAAGLGVNPYDVTQNIQGGISYLGSLFAQFGDWNDALAAYNWGPANVVNAGGIYPASVASYVNGVLSQANSYGASLGPSIATVASSPAAAVAPILNSVGLGSLDPYLPTSTLGMAALAIGGGLLLVWLLD